MSRSEEALDWVSRFVEWYNSEHLHSGIFCVTLNARHEIEDAVKLKSRRLVYELSFKQDPTRWRRGVRNWKYQDKVFLNPESKKDWSRGEVRHFFDTKRTNGRSKSMELALVRISWLDILLRRIIVLNNLCLLRPIFGHSGRCLCRNMSLARGRISISRLYRSRKRVNGRFQSTSVSLDNSTKRGGFSLFG
jgi:hypothetical protein